MDNYYSYPKPNENYLNFFDILKQHLINSFLADCNSSYIFLGLHAAVLFWKHEESFLLFNSHSLDQLVQYSNRGVGRLLPGAELNSLAKLLFSHLPDGSRELDTYEIFRVNVTSSQPNLLRVPFEVHFNNHDCNTSKILNETKFIEPLNNEDPKLFMQCVVRLEILPKYILSSSSIFINSNSKTFKKKAGRPTIKARGRPKISTQSRAEQHREAV